MIHLWAMSWVLLGGLIAIKQTAGAQKLDFRCNLLAPGDPQSVSVWNSDPECVFLSNVFCCELKPWHGRVRKLSSPTKKKIPVIPPCAHRRGSVSLLKWPPGPENWKVRPSEVKTSSQRAASETSDLSSSYFLLLV